MTITDNYNITQLFVNKHITIYTDTGSLIVRIPSIRDFYDNADLNSIYHLWTSKIKEVQSLFLATITDSFEIVTTMIFQYGQYKQYRNIADKMRDIMPWFFPQIKIDMSQKQILINNIIINAEIWDYILYILKLSCGEKVIKPLTFDSEEARKFYMAQREQEDKISKIKEQKQSDKDGLIKILLSITYAFPSMTIDYLFDQSMAQIQWLQKYAAGAMSYEVNAKVLAAGNMKKGAKLDFFIK